VLSALKLIVRAMQKLTSRKAIIQAVANRRTDRVLRAHGIGLTAKEVCELVAAGSSNERTRLTSRLLELANDKEVEAVLVAAFSGYVGALIHDTRDVDLTHAEMWSIGMEALLNALRAAARCDGGDFHIIRSTSRDFVRAMKRHRGRRRQRTEFVRLERDRELVDPSTSFHEQLTSASVAELVEWVATQFDADVAVAQMVIATRVGGYSLGSAGRSTERVRNCRDRQRVEAKIRGFVSPAEGLAANVLERVA